MHRVNEIMSQDVVHIAPTDSIRHAAQLMERYDVGALPVCDNNRLIGMVTDRDLAVRAISAGKPPETRIHEVASGPIEWCFDDDSLDEIQHYMADAQLRAGIEELPHRHGSILRPPAVDDLADAIRAALAEFESH